MLPHWTLLRFIHFHSLYCKNNRIHKHEKWYLSREKYDKDAESDILIQRISLSLI